MSGRVSRDDVAAICVESITREDTKNATFECYDADTAKPLGEVGFSNLMKATGDADGVRDRSRASRPNVGRHLHRLNTRRPRRQATGRGFHVVM